MAWETVIGLEVHAQLATNTKIFSGALVEFGAEPNTNVTPLCLGLPGTLPVLNKQVVELSMRMSLSVGCTIQPRSRFLRKNYFYPDLPKGYQISQFQSQEEMPLATGGGIEIPTADGGTRFVRLVRIHMEEDAGKSIHDEEFVPPGESMVDYNRTGVPLIEIVSEPDMRAPAEAAEYVTRLREILIYTSVSHGDMEKGHVRIDANVSIRPVGSTELGTKVEVKNMNSIRNCQRALEIEVERQIETLEGGGEIRQETMLFDPAREDVRPMRGKEESDDYRYFPDPDLVPILVDQKWIDRVKQQIPELPSAKRVRFATDYGFEDNLVEVLTADRDAADYFESVVIAGADARKAANWVQGDILRLLNENKISIANLKVSSKNLANLIGLIDDGTLSNSVGRQVFHEMADTGETPDAVVKRLGLAQISDEEELESAVDQVLADHSDEVEKFKEGNKKLMGFFMGQVMKATRGQANPKLATHLISKKLG
ncbi:MAG TPA: Asp-tRNA(Asn)/Glu-tRNA(Gln) amidotransferase GatCAB subunit B [Candidatus Latescibacteria bacterium]|nr:Asp-tRNA(Asn)/Glu-tRNA(Gln) amidotransferase GatCAB subunit B [Candidatus Latescibacterota bacterium]